MATAEYVFERILSRVDREELSAQCRDVAQREAKLIERRIRGARRLLQHAYDVNAACQQLPFTTDHNAIMTTPTTTALIRDIEKLQKKITMGMRELAKCVADGPVVAVAAVEENMKPKPEPTPAATEPTPAATGPTVESPATTKRTCKKRRLSHESMDSPRKPPRPGRLAMAAEEEEDDEQHGEESIGPHEITSAAEEEQDSDDDESDEDETPMDLDVLDSDTEFNLAAYLEKARRLRKISSERRMSELPGLIRCVLAEIKRQEWTALPRELLGTLSATMGAATTLKPAQRQELSSELNKLRAVAMRIGDATARKYPTLQGSKARFLSSLEDLYPPSSKPTEPIDVKPVVEDLPVEVPSCEPAHSASIESLSTATAELARRTEATDEPKSMEEIQELLPLVDHVFDNPSVARSGKYSAMVATALTILITYVQGIARTTRRKLQCEQLLQERLMQVTGITRVDV